MTLINVVLDVNKDNVTKAFVFQQMLPNVSCCRVILLQVGEGGKVALSRKQWSEAKVGCCRLSSDIPYAPEL